MIGGGFPGGEGRGGFPGGDGQDGFPAPGGVMIGGGFPGSDGQGGFPDGGNAGRQGIPPSGNAAIPQEMGRPGGNSTIIDGTASQNGIDMGYAITIAVSLLLLIAAIVFIVRPRKAAPCYEE